MMRFVVALVAVISYASVAVGQLAYGKGFVPATALFPSSGTSCTLENSLSDGAVKHKIYWWSCTVNSNTTARFSFVSPALGTTYGQAAVAVRIMTTSASVKNLCAVFSSHAYFSANALQVNQTGSNWRNTTWIGGALGNAQEIALDVSTSSWLLMAAPSLSAAGPSIIDVTNATPNPAPSANEIVVREVIIGGCGNFCSGTTPPSCCSASNCPTTDYSGTVRIYGVHFY